MYLLLHCDFDPFPRGATRENGAEAVTPVCRESRVSPVEPQLLARVVFLFPCLARRIRVQPHPAFPAPLMSARAACRIRAAQVRVQSAEFAQLTRLPPAAFALFKRRATITSTSRSQLRAAG